MNIADDLAEKMCRGKGGAHTCSFLMMGGNGWECAKGTPVEGIILDRRRAGTMNAIGDNCSGAPDFVPSTEELQLN